MRQKTKTAKSEFIENATSKRQFNIGIVFKGLSSELWKKQVGKRNEREVVCTQLSDSFLPNSVSLSWADTITRVCVCPPSLSRAMWEAVVIVIGILYDHVFQFAVEERTAAEALWWRTLLDSYLVLYPISLLFYTKVYPEKEHAGVVYIGMFGV